MASLIYYIAIPFIYLLSFLPFRLLYFVSDIAFVIVYYVIGYRKKVVLQNLHNSFPSYTEKEISTICKRYYSYLLDMFLETFKTLTISKKNMLKHCFFSLETKTLFDKLAKEHKNVIMVLGHWGNWEWAGNSFSLLSQHQLFVIYHPLHNKLFDRLMYKMRTRFGTKLIPMKTVYKDMLAHKNILNTTAFIADQTPSHENAYWLNFLNQETPVFKGTETIAKKLNTPVVYTGVKRLGRGYYEICSVLLNHSPSDTKNGELTESHTRMLEKDIINQPETWLWSHKRWKRKRTKH